MIYEIRFATGYQCGLSMAREAVTRNDLGTTSRSPLRRMYNRRLVLITVQHPHPTFQDLCFLVLAEWSQWICQPTHFRLRNSKWRNIWHCDLLTLGTIRLIYKTNIQRSNCSGILHQRFQVCIVKYPHSGQILILSKVFILLYFAITRMYHSTHTWKSSVQTLYSHELLWNKFDK